MSLPLPRREFLKQSAAASVILGFPFLHTSAQVPKNGSQADFMKLAQERMKQENKPGIAIVVPPNPEAAELLGEQLARLIGVSGPLTQVDREVRGKGIHLFPIGGGDAATHRLFCQAVFVCQATDPPPQPGPAIKPEVSLVLMGENGWPQERVTIGLDQFGKDFTSTVTQLLHGEKGERLALTVKAQRAALGAEACAKFDKALAQLDADEFQTREAASKQLGQLAPRATALLAAALEKKPTPEVRRRLEEIFDNLHAATPQDKPGLRMPYGAEWKTRTVDPCPPCGLSQAPNPTRVFLNFVTTKAK